MMKLENVRDVTSDALPNIWLTPLIGIIIMGSFCLILFMITMKFMQPSVKSLMISVIIGAFVALLIVVAFMMFF